MSSQVLHANEGPARDVAEAIVDSATVTGSGLVGVTVGHLLDTEPRTVRAWCECASLAWAFGDLGTRHLARELAMIYTDCLSDKRRRGQGFFDVPPSDGVTFRIGLAGDERGNFRAVDAIPAESWVPVPPAEKRRSSARELAREIVTARGVQADLLRASREHGRDAARVEAMLLADARAAIFGMYAARRLYNRPLWEVCVRRALRVLLRAQSFREFNSNGGPYPPAQRDETAWRLVMLVASARVRAVRRTLDAMHGHGRALPRWPNVWDGQARERLDVHARDVKRLEGDLVMRTFFFDAEGAADYAAGFPGDGGPVHFEMPRDAWALILAARLRGWEEDAIHVAPFGPGGYSDVYGDAEQEDVVKAQRTRAKGDAKPGASSVIIPTAQQHAGARLRGKNLSGPGTGSLSSRSARSAGKGERRKKPEAKPPNRRTCAHPECTENWEKTREIRCLRVDASRVKK